MYQRRSFLRNSIAAAAAAMVAPDFLMAQSSPSVGLGEVQNIPPQKVSILSYSFHGLVRKNMQDIFGYFETCKYRYELNTADLWNGHFAPGTSFIDPNDKKNYVRVQT